MQRHITRGAAAGAGLIFHIFAQDSAATNGAGKASVGFASWTCRYIRNGEAISGAITPEDITTIGTYAAPTAATNIRIKAVDNTNMIGVYEVQIHLDWVNVTNLCQSLTIYLTASGVAVLPIQIPFEGWNRQDTVRGGLTSLPNAAAEAAGGLYTRGTGAGQLSQSANGELGIVTLSKTITTYTGDTPQTGDSFARIGVAGAGLTNIDLPNQTMDITGNITGNLSGSVGSVTGAVGSVTGLTAATVHADLDDIQARLPAALTANGNMKSSVMEFIATALTETSGQIAAAFKKFFDKAAPTGTINSIPDAVAGANGGLFIAGTNAATTITTALTTTFTGNLTGSVASVTAGVTLAASAVQAIWDAATTALTTAGSIGKKLADWTILTSTTTADAVWNAVATSYNVALSMGNKLNAAGSAGDPWTTALPGAYGAGTAGKIVGDNLNATVSSRATQTSVDDVPTNAELATALAAADDATLAAIAALNNLSQANIRTALGLAAANLDTQLDAIPTNAELAVALGTADDAVLAQVALVKAKTDLIPAAPAAVGDVPTALQNADAFLARNLGSGTGAGVLNERTVRAALRMNRNKFTIVAGVLTVTKENDVDPAWTAAVTTTPGDPVSASDPV